MSQLTENSAFRTDYERLREVSLNPARHAAANAYEHCEMVVQRTIELAALNGCGPEQTALLRDLAHVHDIGKIAGTANPESSVSLLPKYGVTDQQQISLVKYHDTNLPWFVSVQRGDPPGDKAWNKIARKVNMRLLCLFMVADRVDCPGGWRANEPLVWFLEEAQQRGFLPSPLVLDDGPVMPIPAGRTLEVSAGAVVLRGSGPEPQVLVLRVRKEGYEVPKGHVEPGEPREAAALRELREETALTSPLAIGPEVGVLQYAFEAAGATVTKRVHYFVAFAGEPVQFGELPRRTKEIRWLRKAEVDELPLVNEELRTLIRRTFGIAR